MLDSTQYPDLPEGSPYQIRAMVQLGSIGAVYRAYDPRRGHEVALKGLWGDSPLSEEERRSYFHQEAAILKRIKHPRVPSLVELVDGERPFLAMTLIEGEDLQARLDANPSPLPLRDVLNWIMQIGGILDVLHHLPEPVVFRDCKPSHIVIDASGEAWLVDFNIAMVLPPNGVALDATLEGTEGFAAPEQYRGKVTPATDVFGLAATLHYLLTRRDPRLEEPFSFHWLRPSSVHPECPESLDEVIFRALRNAPSKRTQSAHALQRALRRELDQWEGGQDG